MVSSGGVLTAVQDRAGGADRGEGAMPAVTAPSDRRARRLRVVLRTVVLYAVTLFAAVTVIFAIPRAMPGDPIQAREDPSDSLYVSDPAARERLLAYYGLDKPLVTQYREYLGRIVQGDFGWSISRNIPVRDLVGQHLPWTFLLMGTALLLSSAISFLAGIGAAWRRGTATDRVLVVTMTGARAIPEYALAAVLLPTAGPSGSRARTSWPPRATTSRPSAAGSSSSSRTPTSPCPRG